MTANGEKRKPAPETIDLGCQCCDLKAERGRHGRPGKIVYDGAEHYGWRGLADAVGMPYATLVDRVNRNACLKRPVKVSRRREPRAKPGTARAYTTLVSAPASKRDTASLARRFQAVMAEHFA